MATIKYYLKNKANKKGLYPIYLIVTKDSKQKMISVKYYCKKDQWDAKREKFKTNYPDHNIRNQVLLKKQQEALSIIDKFEIENKDWQLDDFERAFKNIGSKPPTVAEMFDEHIQGFEKAGKLNTAKAYKYVKSNLLKYAGKNLTFTEIDRNFLEKYDLHLESTHSGKGKKNVFAHLKTIVNKARGRGVIPKEPYCFEGFNFSKFKSEKKKEALTMGELKRFKDLDLSKHPHLIEAHDYFLFSVGVRGMNFIDIVNLKWSDIQGDRIIYTRSKTKKSFNLKIIPMVQEILNRYEEINKNSAYVFPILLSDDLTPKQIHNRSHKVLSRYNKKLKELARMAGIKKNVTSYVARHTFATILKLEGNVSINEISELMGHSNVNVTMGYLKEFDHKSLDEASSMFDDL